MGYKINFEMTLLWEPEPLFDYSTLDQKFHSISILSQYSIAQNFASHILIKTLINLMLALLGLSMWNLTLLFLVATHPNF